MAAKLDKGKVVEGRYWESISGAAEGGTIGFGMACVKGTDPTKQFKAFASDDNSQKVAGFALFTNSGSIDDLEYDEYDAMRVLRKGVIMAEVSSNADTEPTAGDQVAIDKNGNVITAAEVDNDSGSNGTYAAKLPNSEFVTGGAAGDKVKIEINFPMTVSWVQLSY